MGTVILGTAAGLVLLFALLALFCSAVCEVIANALQMRAKFLLRGLRTMLDQSVSGKTTPVYSDHPGDGTAVDSLYQDNSRADSRLHREVLTPDRTAHAAKVVNDLAVAANAGAAEVLTPAGAVTGSGPAAIPAARQATTPSATTATAPPPLAADDPSRLALEAMPDGLTLALFAHPLVQSLQTARLSLRRGSKRNPPYISADLFARALMDTLVPDSSGATTLTQLENTVRSLPDALPAKKGLLTLVKRADNDVNRFEQLLEQWYDEHMDRVSGWYKRWSRLVLGIVGLSVAILANVDTLQVAHSLYVDQPVRTSVLAQVSEGRLCADKPDPAARTECANKEVAALDAASLPLWWPLSGVHGLGWPVKVLGWLLTAIGVSFGAPFWFDALSRLAPLRSTGPKPAPA